MTATRQRWAERMARYRDCDLTVADFCQDEDVSVASFYYWKRRLRPADPPAEITPRLIPIELTAEGPPAPVEVRLPTGVLIRLNVPVDEPSLRAVLSALGQDRC